MQVVFLGTGNAFASGGRNQMAILVRSGKTGLLLDCGPTTLTALKRISLAPAGIHAVALSHLHGDHFGGLPLLVAHESYEAHRDDALTVMGPPGTKEVVEASCRLFFPGLDPPPFLRALDLEPGREADVSELRLRAFEVDHFSTGVAFGYRVSSGDASVVFSGDTAWTEALVDEAAGADLFICECSSFEAPLDKHMSHRELASNRHRITAKRTLLVHAGDDVLAHRSELVYELAEDGMEVTP